MTKDYDDIINLPHYEPKHHPRMSMWNRAAQFAPFAALAGYEDAINDTARDNADIFDNECIVSIWRLDSDGRNCVCNGQSR